MGGESELLGDVDHHMLDSGVVLKRVRRQIFSVTRFLVPAMRHFSDDRDVGVHPDATKIKVSGTSHCSGNIDGPYALGKPVLNAVCVAQRFAFV